MGDGNECDVVVKASPGAALEMIEADLTFHVLVVALDAPAQLGQSDERLEWSAIGQRGEPEALRGKPPAKAICPVDAG